MAEMERNVGDGRGGRGIRLPWRISILIAAAVFWATPVTAQMVPADASSPAAPADTVLAREHLERAYALLAREQTTEAARELESSLDLNPSRPEVQAQLGYAYTELGRPGRAIDRFERAFELGWENPRAVLQVAYLYDQRGDRAEARAWFQRAAESSDPDVAEQAREELVVRGAAPGLWVTEVYAAPMYQSRYDNVVVPVVVRSGPILEARRLTQPYGFVRLTRDTESDRRGRSDVFAENVAVLGLGLRLRPLGGTLTSYAEVGGVLELDERLPDQRADDFSVQVGLYNFREYGVRRDGRRRVAHGPFAELYYDASYYSRFDDNLIGYLQFKPGYRDNGWLGGTLDLYAPLLLVGDARGRAYNNTLEAGVGARWNPPGLGNLLIGAEYLRGLYLRDAVQGDRTYGDLRLTLSVPRNLAFDWGR